jgi:hypothetical protein
METPFQLPPSVQNSLYLRVTERDDQRLIIKLLYFRVTEQLNPVDVVWLFHPSLVITKVNYQTNDKSDAFKWLRIEKNFGP